VDLSAPNLERTIDDTSLLTCVLEFSARAYLKEGGKEEACPQWAFSYNNGYYMVLIKCTKM